MASVVPEADLWGCSLRVSLAPNADAVRRFQSRSAKLDRVHRCWRSISGKLGRARAVIIEPIFIVFTILCAAVALFAWGRLRSDVVAILVVLALMLSGVLTVQEALAGFSDPVVMLIAAVAIVGEGLVATGVAYRLGEAVMRGGGKSEARLVALVMVLAGSIGAFMSSFAIVAMFIPVVMAIANKTGLNPNTTVAFLT